MQNQLAVWEEFARTKRHVLERGDEEWPANKILLQLACEHAGDSPVTEGAEAWLNKDNCDWLWLRKMRRPKQYERDSCIRVFEGHTDPVNGAIQLGEGRILSWSGTTIGGFGVAGANTLRTWNISTGECLKVFEGHYDKVKGAINLRNGRILSWAEDGTLRIWDADTGQSLFALEGLGIQKHIEAYKEDQIFYRDINGAQQLKDGRILSWSEDHTLRLWNANTGECLAILKGHTESVEGALQLNNGQIISWSRYDDKSLRLWDADTGQCIKVLEGHNGAPVVVQQLDNDRVISFADSTLKVWDVGTGECLTTIKTHADDRGILLLKNGRVLTRSLNQHLRLWDIDTGECLAIFKGHTEQIQGMQQLFDGRIVSWGIDGPLRLWDLDTGENIDIFKGHEDWVSGVQQLFDGRLASWSEGTLRIWDVDSGECLSIHEGHTGTVNGILQLTDGFLSWSEDHTLRLWDVDTRQNSTPLEAHSGEVKGTQQIGNGKLLSWSYDPDLRLWDADTGQCLSVLRGHSSGINGFLLLSEGQGLSWSSDSTLRLWDMKTGECLRTFEGHTDAVYEAFQLSDGRIISWSLNEDTIYRIWDLAGGKCSTTLDHGEWPKGAKQLNDGRILTWDLGGHHLRFWDVDSGEQLAVIPGIEAEQLEDGRIISWDHDRACALRIWDAGLQECQTTLEGHSHTVGEVRQLKGGSILSWPKLSAAIVEDDKEHYFLRIWNEKTGQCRAVLEGHTDWIDNAIQLENGCILSWSEKDFTMRLWDATTGEQLNVCSIEEAFTEATDLWVAYRQKESPHTFTDNGWAGPDEPWQNAQSTDIAKYPPGIFLFAPAIDYFGLWQGEGQWKARHLLSDGKIVVACYKHLEFLALYNGNRRVDLSEAAGLLAAQEN